MGRLKSPKPAWLKTDRPLVRNGQKMRNGQKNLACGNSVFFHYLIFAEVSDLKGVVRIIIGSVCKRFGSSYVLSTFEMDAVDSWNFIGDLWLINSADRDKYFVLTILWLFPPAWDAFKFTLNVCFVCPFVVIDPTDSGATTELLVQAICLSISNLSPTRIPVFLPMVKKLACLTASDRPIAFYRL